MLVVVGMVQGSVVVGLIVGTNHFLTTAEKGGVARGKGEGETEKECTFFFNF